jgi:hypothetical protein
VAHAHVGNRGGWEVHTVSMKRCLRDGAMVGSNSTARRNWQPVGKACQRSQHEVAIVGQQAAAAAAARGTADGNSNRSAEAASGGSISPQPANNSNVGQRTATATAAQMTASGGEHIPHEASIVGEHVATATPGSPSRIASGRVHGVTTSSRNFLVRHSHLVIDDVGVCLQEALP